MTDSDKIKSECSKIAQKLSQNECGELFLGWLMDEYWGHIVKDTLLPNANKIYDALVAKGITQDKKLDFNDADDTAFYIPSPTGVKVWVHTTQNLDFIYIIDDKKFHVRRIYRTWGKRNSYQKVKDVIGSLKKALQNADYLSEYHDDHYEYSRRHSLDYYCKKNFRKNFLETAGKVK